MERDCHLLVPPGGRRHSDVPQEDCGGHRDTSNPLPALGPISSWAIKERSEGSATAACRCPLSLCAEGTEAPRVPELIPVPPARPARSRGVPGGVSPRGGGSAAGATGLRRLGRPILEGTPRGTPRGTEGTPRILPAAFGVPHAQTAPGGRRCGDVEAAAGAGGSLGGTPRLPEVTRWGQCQVRTGWWWHRVVTVPTGVSQSPRGGHSPHGGVTVPTEMSQPHSGITATTGVTQPPPRCHSHHRGVTTTCKTQPPLCPQAAAPPRWQGPSPVPVAVPGGQLVLELPPRTGPPASLAEISIAIIATGFPRPQRAPGHGVPAGGVSSAGAGIAVGTRPLRDAATELAARRRVQREL